MRASSASTSSATASGAARVPSSSEPADREVGQVEPGLLLDGRVGGGVPLVGGGGVQRLGHGDGLVEEGRLLHALEQGVEEAVIGVEQGIGGDEDRQALVAGGLVDLPELPGSVRGVLDDGHEALPGEHLLLGVGQSRPGRDW